MALPHLPSPSTCGTSYLHTNGPDILSPSLQLLPHPPECHILLIFIPFGLISTPPVCSFSLPPPPPSYIPLIFTHFHLISTSPVCTSSSNSHIPTPPVYKFLPHFLTESHTPDLYCNGPDIQSSSLQFLPPSPRSHIPLIFIVPFGLIPPLPFCNSSFTPNTVTQSHTPDFQTTQHPLPQFAVPLPPTTQSHIPLIFIPFGRISTPPTRSNKRAFLMSSWP